MSQVSSPGIVTSNLWAVRMADSVLQSYPEGRWKWHYEHGLVVRAIAAVGDSSGEPRFQNFDRAWVDFFVAENGTINTYRVNEFNLDQVCPGRLLFPLYRRTGDERYVSAIQHLRRQLREQPRTPSGGFWHKQIYPNQMWLDGLFMAGPFYAEYAVHFNEPAIFDDLTFQFILMEQNARDPQTGLLYHAWDETQLQKWANPETGRSPHFWGRAIGWYAMALVEVLDLLPTVHPQYSTLIEILNRVASAMTCYQDANTGLWYQVVNLPERTGNYLESSVSAMMAYSLARAVRQGWLALEYLPAAQRAFRGLLENKVRVDENGALALDGICSVAGLGGNPYRDGSYEYYIKEPVVTNDFKGVGPFILAALEMDRLQNRA